MNAKPASSALSHADPARAAARRRGAPPYMSDQQVQAYLTAREALRSARQAAKASPAGASARHGAWRLSGGPHG